MGEAAPISVLLPVYNSQAYLKAAVESILGQDFGDFEFIIVNDGSTDQSGQILRDYAAGDGRILLIEQENRGVIGALNRGLGAARGEYIARMDADDISEPDRLGRQLAELRARPDLVVLGSAYTLIDASDSIVRVDQFPAEDALIRWQLLFYSPFAHPTVMMRRDILEKEKIRYDETARHAEDYGLWSKLLYFGRGANLSLPLLRHRSHELQKSRIIAELLADDSNRIAHENQTRLVGDITLEEAVQLRVWQRRFPSRLDYTELGACRRFFELLTALEGQPGLGAGSLKPIRARLARRIVWASRGKALLESWMREELMQIGLLQAASRSSRSK
jgi:hypothetical protein